jgi:membrane protease YdiL (CAAX protease family)
MDFTSPMESLESGAEPTRPKRLRWGPWATLAWSIPIIVIMIVSQTLGAFAYLRWWRFAHPEAPISLEDLSSNGAVLAFSLAVSAPIVLGALAFVVRLSRIPLADYLALKWPRLRDVGTGIVLLVLVLIGAGILAGITGQQPPAFIADTFETARAAGMLPLLLVSFVFLGPLQEEALFRGFLFRGFAPSLGVWPTVVITAALWAITHVQYQWFFMGEIFALGLAFGWLRARSGSLLLTLGLHMAINAIALVEAASMAGS